MLIILHGPKKLKKLSSPITSHPLFYLNTDNSQHLEIKGERVKIREIENSKKRAVSEKINTSIHTLYGLT